MLHSKEPQGHVTGSRSDISFLEEGNDKVELPRHTYMAPIEIPDSDDASDTSSNGARQDTTSTLDQAGSINEQETMEVATAFPKDTANDGRFDVQVVELIASDNENNVTNQEEQTTKCFATILNRTEIVEMPLLRKSPSQSSVQLEPKEEELGQEHDLDTFQVNAQNQDQQVTALINGTLGSDVAANSAAQADQISTTVMLKDDSAAEEMEVTELSAILSMNAVEDDPRMDYEATVNISDARAEALNSADTPVSHDLDAHLIGAGDGTSLSKPFNLTSSELHQNECSVASADASNSSLTNVDIEGLQKEEFNPIVSQQANKNEQQVDTKIDPFEEEEFTKGFTKGHPENIGEIESPGPNTTQVTSLGSDEREFLPPSTCSLSSISALAGSQVSAPISAPNVDPFLSTEEKLEKQLGEYSGRERHSPLVAGSEDQSSHVAIALQEKDIVMAELKNMKIASIHARNAALHAEIATLRSLLKETTQKLEAPAAETVKRHIKLLHDYNDIRDVGQGLIGMIADGRSVRIGEIYPEYGIGLKD